MSRDDERSTTGALLLKLFTKMMTTQSDESSLVYGAILKKKELRVSLTL